jgi:hypothetical protein
VRLQQRNEFRGVLHEFRARLGVQPVLRKVWVDVPLDYSGINAPPSASLGLQNQSRNLRNLEEGHPLDAQ